MRISLIVAMAENRVIGRDGQLPWRLSADLRRFKLTTMGHHILMGRRTLESIGRLLPGRQTIVMTRDLAFQFPGALVAHTWQQAIDFAEDDTELFVCGGAEIYRLALPHVRRMYVTTVAAVIEGDAQFPEIDWNHWSLVSEDHHAADDRNEFAHSFRIWERA
ncbi:MAG: dihydrofolate reductase [Pirellulaceae bacterium]